MQDVKKLKKLIETEKSMASNPKTPRYSANTKMKITELTKQMTTKQIVDELKISKSFVEQLKKGTRKDCQATIKNSKTNTDHSGNLQFLQLDNQFNNLVKEVTTETMPTTIPIIDRKSVV